MPHHLPTQKDRGAALIARGHVSRGNVLWRAPSGNGLEGGTNNQTPGAGAGHSRTEARLLSEIQEKPLD